MSIRPLGVAVASLLVLSAGGRAADPEQELEAVQKKLLHQLLNGQPTPAELTRLVAEMNKLMRMQFPELQPLELPRPELPGVDGRPGKVPPRVLEPLVRALEVAVPEAAVPEAALPQGPADREAIDKKLKEFDEAIEKLKDDPDAQAELKKARDEFKKAVEEELRKGGGVIERPRPNPIDRPFRPLPVPDVRAVPFPAALDPNVRLVRPSGPVRLGVVFEKPHELLVEHLNLPADVGVVIVEVQPGSPADKAGLRKNDVVVRLGGRDAPSDLNRFQALVADLRAGEKLDAVVYRKGKREVLGGLELSPARR